MPLTVLKWKTNTKHYLFKLKFSKLSEYIFKIEVQIMEKMF